MRRVGDSLLDLAVAERDAGAADEFGRSAFNRYYYAVYLIVRKAVMSIDPKWASCSHKDLPELLTKQLYRAVRGRARFLERKGYFNRGQSARLVRSFKICSSDLAQLLRTSYGVRCVADYSPEERIQFRDGTVHLGETTAGAAQRWPDRAERSSGQLRASWKKLGY